jgi:hypothetical protein
MAVLQTKYAIVPKWVSESDLSDRAIRLYVILANHANNTSRHSHHGRKRLAEECRCSESSLDRAMKELVAHGAVVVKPRYDEAGDRTSNDYWVPIDPPSGVGGSEVDGTGGVRDDATGGVTVDEVTRRTIELDEVELDSVASQRAIDHQLTTTQRLMDEYEAPVITTYPSEPLTVEAEPSSPSSAPPPSPTPYDWWIYVCRFCNWNPEVGKALGIKMVKGLMAAGVEPQQIINCAYWLEADPYWAGKGVDIKLVGSQMQRFLSRKEVPKRKTIHERYEETMADPSLSRIFGED